MQSTDDKILARIKKARGGTLFFTDSFSALGEAKTINKALTRLVRSGELRRVATGIYVRPAKDKKVGMVMPGIDEIARAIAKRDKARIVPTGSYALYKLGLTTQMPLNVVYYTSASSRKIRIGRRTLTFKKASARNLSAVGEVSKLVIQALRTIGKDQVKPRDLEKIKQVLKKEEKYRLQHDLKVAPVWMRKLLTS
jgi:predicted transcriptional regulator of viral defense system